MELTIQGILENLIAEFRDDSINIFAVLVPLVFGLLTTVSLVFAIRRWFFRWRFNSTIYRDPYMQIDSTGRPAHQKLFEDAYNSGNFVEARKIVNHIYFADHKYYDALNDLLKRKNA